MRSSKNYGNHPNPNDSDMQPHQVYEHLEILAGQLEITVRYENLRDSDAPARSGLCKVKGRHLYIMDTSTSLCERIRLLSQCLGEMDLDGVFVLPAIRKVLEGAQGRQADHGSTRGCGESMEQKFT